MKFKSNITKHVEQPLRGLDGFPLVPRYKLPQMLGVMLL